MVAPLPPGSRTLTDQRSRKVDDQKRLLAARAQKAAKEALNPALQAGYKVASGVGGGRLQIKRGPRGERIIVKEVTLERPKSVAQKAGAITKRVLLGLGTVGFAAASKDFWSSGKRELSPERITVFTQDLMDEEVREGEAMIKKDVTVRSEDGEQYDIRNQNDMTSYAEKIYKADRTKFTEIEGKGMFFILDPNKGRVLHVPYSDGQHPDFSKACALTFTDSRTGEYITSAEINGRLIKAAKQYSLLYGTLNALVQDAIKKDRAYLLKDDVLNQSAKSRMNEITTLLGTRQAEEMLRHCRGDASLRKEFHEALSKEKEKIQQEKEAFAIKSLGFATDVAYAKGYLELKKKFEEGEKIQVARQLGGEDLIQKFQENDSMTLDDLYNEAESSIPHGTLRQIVEQQIAKETDSAKLNSLRERLHFAIRADGGGSLEIAQSELKYAEKFGETVAAAAREALSDHKASLRGLLEATFSSYEIGPDHIPRPLSDATQRTNRKSPLLITEGSETKLVSSTERQEQLKDIEQKIKQIKERRTATDNDIDAVPDVANIKQRVDDFKESIEEAEQNPQRVGELPDLRANLKKAEGELEKIREKYRTDEFKVGIDRLEKEYKQASAEEKNLNLEIEALESYESAVKAIEDGATGEALTQAQTKAGAALDKLFLSYHEHGGEFKPAGGDNAQLRTLESRKARMEKAIGEVTYNEIYMDPSGESGSGGKVKVGKSGIKFDEKLGAWVQRYNYNKYGEGVVVDIPNQVIDQMMAVYKTEGPPGKKLPEAKSPEPTPPTPEKT